MPKISTLTDDFSGATINTAVWSIITAGAASLDTTHDFVSLAVGTAANTFNNFASGTFYDATESAVYAQVGAAPPGNGGVSTSFRIQVDSSNYVDISLRPGGAFQLRVNTAGTIATTPLPVYDGNTHRWWRLRETAGTFYADTSPDGHLWTTQASMAHSWSATAVLFFFQTGASDTEPAGLVATLANVNTHTGGGNVNFPKMEHGWGPWWGANNASFPTQVFADVTARTQGTFSAGRGTQYELDTVQAGTLSGTLTNSDGLLDPTANARVLPYQPYRLRAQWPPTRNRFSQSIAEATVSGVMSGLSPIIVASTSAYFGNNVWQASVPSGAAVDSLLMFNDQPAVSAGNPYTFSVHARNLTPSTSITVYAQIRWLAQDPNVGTLSVVSGSTVTLTGSATAGWNTVKVSATAPAGVGGAAIHLTIAATTTAATVVQSSAWQWEDGLTATPYCTPGLWSGIHSGFVERWPQTWLSDNSLSVTQPQSVDALALLSQTTLDDPLTEEINKHSPRFLYRLDDPQGSQQVADATGNNPPAAIGVAKAGPGSLTLGVDVTASDPVNGVFASSGTVCNISNPSPGVQTYAAATFVDLRTAGINGPANSGTANWARMIAFRYTGPTPAVGASATIWASYDQAKGFGSRFAFYVGPDGKAALAVAGQAGINLVMQPVGGGPLVTDGDWHLIIASFQGPTTMSVSVDGQIGTYNISGSVPTGLFSDSIGSLVDPSIGNAAAFNFAGDVAFAAEFPLALLGSDIPNLYAAWRNAFSGESSDTRYSRILGYAGYTGAKTLSAGLTQSMGPASISGQDALSALSDVVTTEGGQHFVAADGRIVFQSRGDRYSSMLPAYTFGDGPGEHRYEEVDFDFDPTHLGNDIEVTQASTGQVFTAEDTASQAAYFPRALTRTVNVSDPYEAQSAAQYLRSRYAQPQFRVETMVLSPASNPALWSVALALELGMRIRVIRRPLGRSPISVDMFVQSLSWSIDGNGAAKLTVQAAPVDLTPYGSFAAWHTTTKAAYPVGTTGIAVAPVAGDSNLLAALIAPGQQLTLEPGTANAETVTVDHCNTTAPGWTSGTIVLAATTTKSHPLGAVVCEVLPGSVTDPTTWDSVSKFDQEAFVY